MGQVLHGSATTTEAIRRAIQHSQESLRALAKRHGINEKTVAKWKRRSSVADLPTGPREPRSTVLSIEDEAIIVAFRKHTLLPLDEGLSVILCARQCVSSDDEPLAEDDGELGLCLGPFARRAFPFPSRGIEHEV
jgi:transposase-like protein